MIQDRTKVGEIIDIQKTYMQRDKDGYLRLIIVDGQSKEWVMSEVTGSHGMMQQITPKEECFFMKDVDKINKLASELEDVSHWSEEKEIRDKLKNLNVNTAAYPRRFA